MFQSQHAVYRESKGLVGAHGPEWCRVRSLVQQDMLRPESAMFYIPSIDQISRDLTNLIDSARGEDNKVEDVLDYVFRCDSSYTTQYLDSPINGVLMTTPGGLWSRSPRYSWTEDWAA